MYPTPSQVEALLNMHGAHQRLYNAALEQRISAWRTSRTSVGFVDQCFDLTELRADDPVYAGLNAQSSQVTLRRLDRAFGAFFRRCKAGQSPGFPRFKSFERFSGWGYKTHGDGFTFISGNGKVSSLKDGARQRHGILRLSGIGNIKLRGRARNPGEVTTCEIKRKNGNWYASITVRCTPVRKSGYGAVGHDWGVTTFATYAYADGTFNEVRNPRFSGKHKAKVERAQRHLDAVMVKDALGRPTNGKEVRRIAAKRALGRAKMHEANALHDFLHQQSAREVRENCLIVTEQLSVRNMTRSAKGTVEEPGKNVAQKAGLNREILATAPATYNKMRQYKAAEAGIWYIETPTRTLKPTQRCSNLDCWKLPKKNKTLDERMHQCQFCGLVLGRDRNGALVNLRWVFKNAANGSMVSDVGPGTGLETLPHIFLKIGWS